MTSIEYCTPTQCELLRAAGLHTTSVLSLYHAAKWLREVHGVDIVVSPRFDSNIGNRIGYFWRWSQRTDVKDEIVYKNYEGALSAGIDAVIEPFKRFIRPSLKGGDKNV
jgi:hypothetical protein